MKIPNARFGDVVVRALSVRNVFSGYMEGGPDAGRLWAALEGDGGLGVRASCVRFDKTISLEAPSREMVRRVPRWSHHARVAFVVDDEPRNVVVSWLADGIGDESIEEMLARGIGDADLTRAESPMPLAAPTRTGRFEAFTLDGCDVGAYGWRFDFGPQRASLDGPERGAILFRGAVASEAREVDLEIGEVLASAFLVGPDLGDDLDDRVGRRDTVLHAHLVCSPGSSPLGRALAAAIECIHWRSHATTRFDDDDDY